MGDPLGGGKADDAFKLPQLGFGKHAEMHHPPLHAGAAIESAAGQSGFAGLGQANAGNEIEIPVEQSALVCADEGNPVFGDVDGVGRALPRQNGRGANAQRERVARDGREGGKPGAVAFPERKQSGPVDARVGAGQNGIR